jgi:aldehyde:ferredoxin oxidoreductase
MWCWTGPIFPIDHNPYDVFAKPQACIYQSHDTLFEECLVMEPNPLTGYMGKILRVDLSNENTITENFDEKTYRKYIGGVGIGIKILYDEVPPGTSWSDPENRLILATGPLNGTTVPGSGTVCAVSKGCLTGGGSSSQANGYFGAYLKSSSLDGVIVQGAANRWKYLHISNGKAKIREAQHLAGRDTVETETLIKEELQKKPSQISVYSIGPNAINLSVYIQTN